jgi:short-subunit dehydrogenase
MNTDLRNQTALITGASSGIGEALARELARRGTQLVLLARRRDRLEQLAADLQPTGVRVLCCEADVSRDGDVERAVEQAHAELGPIDIVVANAGISIGGHLMHLSMEEHRRQLETNFFGVLRTFHATRDDLLAGRGRIAVVGSVNGYLPLPGGGPYAISKFAVRAFCDALRMEALPMGISVTHVIPGFIATDFRKMDNQGRLHPERKDAAPAWLQMPARQAAQEIADAIALRQGECILTGHGKLAVWFQHFLPGALEFLMPRFKIDASPGSRKRPSGSERDPQS